MKLLSIVFFVALTACATDDADRRVYTTQTVKVWKDANGKIHMKGEGAAGGYQVISEPRRVWVEHPR